MNNDGDVATYWVAAEEIFDDQLPLFQTSGYEVLLLPLYAQAVNLYLPLLRDGVKFGLSWGWTSEFQQSILAKMSNALPPLVSYAKTYFQQGIASVVAKTKSNNHDCEPFKTVNTYVRYMTLAVSDYGQVWPFLDPGLFPNPVAVHLGREIYSDPVGTCDDSGNIVIPTPPIDPPNVIKVWRRDHDQAHGRSGRRRRWTTAAWRRFQR